MDDCLPRKLEVWPGGAVALPPEAEPSAPADLAERLYATEVFAVARRSAAEPLSPQWFLDAEAQRHGRHGRWLPQLFEFGRHAGETVLTLGRGLGIDWAQYARHGADVIVCAEDARLAIVRRHFESRHLSGRFLSAQSSKLPLESASVDVACLTEALEECPDPRQLVDEVYRVLRPGGKVLALTAARYDVDYWSRRLLPWRWLRTSAEEPGTNARRLRRLFDRFVEPRVHKRQLRRADVPHLWRVVPLPLLERLVGRVLVVKAFKPLSAAMAVRMAA